MIVSCTDQGYILLIWLWGAVELTLKITLVLQLNFESSPWHMAFLDTEMKELGRSNQQNIHYTRSLVRAPQVCLRHFAHWRSFHGGTIHTHKYTHTHTHTHTYIYKHYGTIIQAMIILIIVLWLQTHRLEDVIFHWKKLKESMHSLIL